MSWVVGRISEGGERRGWETDSGATRSAPLPKSEGGDSERHGATALHFVAVKRTG